MKKLLGIFLITVLASCVGLSPEQKQAQMKVKKMKQSQQTEINTNEEVRNRLDAFVKQKKEIELEKMIKEARSTCKSLGFREGTEKYLDCGLKIYSLNVEIAAENNKPVVKGFGSDTVTIYDPVRDSNALMRQGQRMLSGACTLGVNC